MDFYDLLALIGGLALFLFGMQLMGNALEKKAGSGLKNILEKMTERPITGFLLGLIVTCVIQSSSATTVMVVGFVNSGIMKLRQAIYIIMGSNIGTTITAWILSLTGVSGEAWYIQIFKPQSFVPILALIGVIFFAFLKSNRRKDTGLILLGFATLMTGMEAMSDAVAGLREVPQFANILTLFTNPILGVLAGAVLTAVIQSSSASVGILQALSSTGAISFGAAVPIIMGQNIGTCATALLSCMGANKNAKRTAFVHLYFNVLGTLVLLALFSLAKAFFGLGFLDSLMIDGFWIAVVHTAFNVLCTILWIPFIGFLEKLACITVRDTEEKEHYEILDERLLATSAIAVDRCRAVAGTMASLSADSIKDAFLLLDTFDEKLYEQILAYEEKVDRYEDHLGSYLVKVSALELTDRDSLEAAILLHIISDFERISDHAVNILQSAEEIRDKKLQFSGEAKAELSVMIRAVDRIVGLARDAFLHADLEAASMVEPLEQVVDSLKDTIKSKHIERLQKGGCTIELGFVLTDLLTNLERISDHCSNIAGCMLEMAHKDLAIHQYLRSVKGGEGEQFNRLFAKFQEEYHL